MSERDKISLVEKNTLAYFSGASKKRKKCFMILTPDRRTSVAPEPEHSEWLYWSYWHSSAAGRQMLWWACGKLNRFHFFKLKSVALWHFVQRHLVCSHFTYRINKQMMLLFGAKTFTITTLNIRGYFVTASINDAQHNNALSLCWVSLFIDYYVE